MKAEETYRGRTYVLVTVTGVRGRTRDNILTAALDAACESRSSVFDWRVRIDSEDDDRAVVSLITD